MSIRTNYEKWYEGDTYYWGLIYSTGTVQYIFEENKKSFFDKLNKLTKKNGIVYINVFVEKPFLELPPD